VLVCSRLARHMNVLLVLLSFSLVFSPPHVFRVTPDEYIRYTYNLSIAASCRMANGGLTRNLMCEQVVTAQPRKSGFSLRLPCLSMGHQVLNPGNFPSGSVSLPSPSVLQPQATPIEENMTAKASWIPAKSGLHFIAGGSVSKVLHDNTRRAERVFPAGWVACVEEWSLRRSMS
jgi:hypothetical protein